MDTRFISLVLRTAPNNEDIWIRCLRETAELYGWTDIYEEQVLGKTRRLNDEGRPLIQVTRKRQDIGGIGIRISRHEDKSKLRAGFVNRLRLHSRVTNRDLAELAHFTKADWHWLESKSFKRVTREESAEIYEVVK